MTNRHNFVRKTVPLWALIVLLFGAGAEGEDAHPEAAPVAENSVEVPENYLEPLKLLESEEAAFVEKMWEMGDSNILRIQAIQEKLVTRTATPEEMPGLQRESYQRVLELKALADYAAERFSQNAEVRNFKGEVLYDYLGQQEGGAKEWLVATSLNSDYADPYCNLALHYFHFGSYELGFENMDKALDLEPENPNYCYHMAQNYLVYRPQTEKYRGWSAKKVYKEAMKFSKKAVELAPDDYELLEDYAVNFLAAENFQMKTDWKQQAKAWQAAREHAPGKTERYFTWLNEGRAWRELDKKDEAIRCFKEAQSIRPESELVPRLIQELESES